MLNLLTSRFRSRFINSIKLYGSSVKDTFNFALHCNKSCSIFTSVFCAFMVKAKETVVKHYTELHLSPQDSSLFVTSTLSSALVQLNFQERSPISKI
jgi:hypothetical protein